ncbi:integral membrane sensor signal transduction histidine kinase [Clostridium cellulovorans 743B]|uniref:histidine kinase n=2 Tax=Clostridium cellulovorans TaxID=1493 RepID=D9SNM8_CLOC7|nr:integral membrane sensor signal transduction histidine kinase [Clostridium cellulovorans 743B]
MKIATKLFIITSIFFMLFLTFTIVFQKTFLERMYKDVKRDSVTKTVSTFKEEFEGIVEGTEVYFKIKKLEQEGNIKLVVLLSNNQFPIRRIPTAMGWENVRSETIIPSSDETGDRREQDIDAIIASPILDEDKLNRLYSGETITFLDKNLKCVVSMECNETRKAVIIGYTSLQPINDAIDVMSSVYKYFIILSVFVVFLITVFFVRAVTKPLKKINEGAMKMADLDFSEPFEIDREDEIGSVALSLNILSNNLNNALSSLTAANIKLKEDIEKGKRLEEMRKDFIAAASHELKTPITLIKGYAEGIKDDVFEGEELEESLDIIIDESEKMAKLVEGMLELSRLENETIELDKVSFNIQEMIELEIRKFQNELEKKNISINRQYEGHNAFGEKFRINEIITNLLSNATRHCDDNGTITVYTNNYDDKVYVSIENTGEKIPEEEQSKIWSKFYKVDKARERKLGGTGLGLAIVNNIIKLHKGSYGVENTETGVRFYFILPLK